MISASRATRLGWLAACGLAAVQPQNVRADDAYVAREYSRSDIYHSPQTPGYTSWVGAWTMPDESMMICFTQATGPLEGRPAISADLQAKWSWPPKGQPGYDFTGLDMHNVYLRSKDRGKTWEQTGAELFHTPGGQMSQGGPQIALPDGTILRAAFGYHLPLDPDVPKTGFLQRSTDGGQSWGERQVLLPADQCTYRITRLRRLRDGRMIALGGIASVESSTVTGTRLTELWRPLLMVSADDGKTWGSPLDIIPEKERELWGGEEWDVAELENGDLLAVFRRLDPDDRTKQARWQGLLKKQGDSWTVQSLDRSALPHSGHPELLATREGPILHVATTGVHFTEDRGQTWRGLKIDGQDATFKSHYYPHGFQTDDGTIYMFAHVGAHDPYGKDQRVTMDKFRLAEQAVPQPPESVQPKVEIVPAEDQTLHAQYRRTLVGPGVHEPEPYQGFTGMVGWNCVTRTSSGAMLLTFTSGYWHGSPPTPLREENAAQLKEYGIAPVEAPRGGRAHFMRSEDDGLTWSDPEVLIDTPGDDRAPAAVQLSDGTLVASFFVWPEKKVGVIRSTDDGKTWEQEPRYLCEPFKWAATDGPPIELPDKSVLLVAYAGDGKEEGHAKTGVFRSVDRGDTWEHAATLSAPFNLDEPSVAQLSDGRLITISRREGAVAWSHDQGRTWTAPVPLPFKMFDPWLLSLRDGTLLCVHGSYTEGKRGVRAILSSDGGETWTAAGPDYGFSIDPSVYGYSRGVQMDDGSIYMVCESTGGHTPEQVKNQKIYALRFRVLENCRGIELLPAPGSDVAAGS